MSTRQPILSAVLLCAIALLTMGNDGGCGGGSIEYCGDGICGGGEDFTGCSADCSISAYCGDGICNGGESPASCSLDCGVDPDCSDGVCDDDDEDEDSCAADCEAAPFCGDGVCDFDEDASDCLGDCAITSYCGDSSCDSDEDATDCAADCDVGAFCGDGDCDFGEDASNCAADCDVAPFCGDGDCDFDEDASNCAADCDVAPFCGDGVCDFEEECPDDCSDDPSCGDGSCDPDETCASCAADCGDCCIPESDARFCERLGKECGSVTAADNCGNQRMAASCGTCEDPQTCGANNVCSAPSGVRPSAGCGLAGDSGRQDLAVTIRGVQRTYKVQFPSNYDPNEPLPLIFYFHWMGATIGDALALSEQAIWEVDNASNQAAFVWPQGLAQYGNNETGWELACDGEDMEFFDAMLSNLADSRCIDLNRVFSTGFSFGADMSVSLACCRDASVVRAVAPASGAFDQANRDFVCPGLSPPSMRYSYGTEDSIYTPGEFSDVISFFHSQLGCSTDYDLVSVSPCSGTWTGNGSTVTCTCKSYRDCSRRFVDCEFANMGHTTAVGWREDTWDYFMSF